MKMAAGATDIRLRPVEDFTAQSKSSTPVDQTLSSTRQYRPTGSRRENTRATPCATLKKNDGHCAVISNYEQTLNS
jgi:hypothetical protein